MTLTLFLLGCNQAPLDYRDLGTARGAHAPWGFPTSQTCEDRPSSDTDVQVGGFTLCARDNDILPIDDPILVPCEDAALDGPLLYVFDGQRVRGYAKSALIGRELVHDEYGGVPVVVDF